MIAVSDAAVNGLYLALTGLLIAGTQILTSWWSAKTRDAKLNAIAATGEKTHTLVNSAMGAQLKMHAAVTRRLAILTKDSADVEAANQAEQLLKEHEGKQAKVDAKESEG
jgi:hypothetical protein